MNKEDVSAVKIAMEEVVKPIADDLAKFQKQYDIDMRGDTDASNGNRGLVNEIRAINQRMKDHPSLTWLLTHRFKITASTIIATGLGIFTLGMLLLVFAGWSGVLGPVIAMFGVPVP